ncbi:transcription factor HHO5-like [Silene latifolia]|uniref:transcription factor HHO5-like n=1 Tax=Silene latifolia TaxID=37657 RepID=UPI003D76D644
MVYCLPELSLDLSPPSVNSDDQYNKFNHFINGLEDELKKIQAFQRELPLSFSLLNDAIGKLKKMEKKGEERRVQLKDKFGEMKDWMSSAQLWAPRNQEEEGSRKAEDDDKAPTLSLATPAVGRPAYNYMVVQPVSEDRTGRPEPRPACHTAERKQRRSWSPELHCRFIDALEKLGGSQVATPKQIRDLMQVDGLTNDEVKSHLQKYRLHVRKVPTHSSVGQKMGRDKPELGHSNSEMHKSRSPESPLNFDISRKRNSSSMEEDDEKSDGHSNICRRMRRVTYC